ncbi:hypothetical protein D9M72_394710 [compost metagenome]
MGRTLRHDHADSSVLVERDRQLGANLMETITVHNYAREPFHCRLEVLADADFADLFEVKECRQAHRISRVRHATRERLTVESERPGDERSITVALTGARIEGRRLLAVTIVPSHTAWSVTLSAVPRRPGAVGRAPGCGDISLFSGSQAQTRPRWTFFCPSGLPPWRVVLRSQ